MDRIVDRAASGPMSARAWESPLDGGSRLAALGDAAEPQHGALAGRQEAARVRLQIKSFPSRHSFLSIDKQ